MKLKRLRVENHLSPIGVDALCPRFSWEASQTPDNWLQSAWEIQVQNEFGMQWESGQVPGGDSIQISYGGFPLTPQTVYRWRVRVFDQNGRASGWSQEAYFETGLMNMPWQGCWITTGLNSGVLQPVAMIRAGFQLEEQPVRARLYVTALGIYTGSLNGQPVSMDCFTPGWTCFSQRVQYQVYDTTELIQTGENVLGFQLNEGWFSGKITRRWNGGLSPEDLPPALRAELHLWFANGSKTVIPSSSRWRTSQCGPIRFADFYDGETFDARLILPDWDRSVYDDSDWDTARESSDYDHVRIEAQTGTAVRRAEVRRIEKITHPTPDQTVLDFGQNLCGRERFHIKLSRDRRLHIRHAEMLNPDGSVYPANLRRARAETVLIGNGCTLQYEPTFTYYGFRYIQLDIPDIDPDDFEVVVIHSAMERTGFFECSNEMINRLFLNALWGQKGNYIDVPMDCPQRDERLGWTGDTQVFCHAASYNYDIERFFEKWLCDLELSCNSEGAYPIIAPYNFSRNCPPPETFTSAGWSDAGIICPWIIYQMYGNRRILKRHYPAMKRSLCYQEKHSDQLIRNDSPLGDWLNINAPTSPELISTAFFGWSALLFSKIAAALGKSHDAAWSLRLHEAIRTAYQKRFLTPDGELREQTQTAALLTLQFDLAPADARQKIAEALIHDITVKHDNHLSTGFLGTPYLADVLTETGYLEEAYALLQQTTYPSWLYPVTLGATTIWERWNSWTPEQGFADASMNSFNHYAYGAIIAWFYHTISGIRPLLPGFKHFQVAPHPGGTLRSARAVFHSPYGEIESNWWYEGEFLRLEVVVPPNTTAEIVWSGKCVTVGSGRHRF